MFELDCPICFSFQDGNVVDSAERKAAGADCSTLHSSMSKLVGEGMPQRARFYSNICSSLDSRSVRCWSSLAIGLHSPDQKYQLSHVGQSLCPGSPGYPDPSEARTLDSWQALSRDRLAMYSRLLQGCGSFHFKGPSRLALISCMGIGGCAHVTKTHTCGSCLQMCKRGQAGWMNLPLDSETRRLRQTGPFAAT